MNMTKQHTQTLLHNESSAKRKFHCTKCLNKESGEIQHYQINRIPDSSRTKRCKLRRSKQLGNQIEDLNQ